MKSNVNQSKFATEQLKKFGWKEGEGIGKSSQGISNPIKASFKFDNSGLGFKISEEFTKNWWENLFDSTAKGIEEERPELAEKSPEESTETVKTPLNRKSYFYSRFQKGSTLIDGKDIETPDVVEEKAAKEKVKRKSKSDDEEQDKLKSNVTDEELFKICNGRTAHKGARHGIKMNGKLSRIEEQERILLESYTAKTSKSSNSEEVDESEPKKKKKKNKKEKEREIEDN